MTHITCYMTHITCYMTHITCYMAHITCYMTHITCYLAVITCYIALITCYIALITCYITHNMCGVVVTLPLHNSVDQGSIPKVGCLDHGFSWFPMRRPSRPWALGKCRDSTSVYKSATTALPSQPFPSLSPVRDKCRA